MKNIPLLNFIKDNIEDEYAMQVFYYNIKDSFLRNDFSLSNVQSFQIDGRYLGYAININLHTRYKTAKHALAFMLSVRLLMLNQKYLTLCEDDGLIIKSKPSESFQWIEYMSFIVDNWDDEEIKMLYSMLEDYYYDEQFTDDEKNTFRNSITIPEYRNEKRFYRFIANKTSGVTYNIISNNTFIDADFDKYVIASNINYIGNTVFAYCMNLETLIFEGKVLFGTFPIIECPKLRKIVVPKEYVAYYKQELPYYEQLICTSIDKEDIDSSLIENKEVKLDIDFKKLETVFNHKATSYKYFWFMAIISLAKEKEILTLSYQEILIRMVVLAWPIIINEDICLGERDLLPKYVDKIQSKINLTKESSYRIIEDLITQNYHSLGINKILSPLLNNVPYRFLSPWIKYTNDEDVKEKSLEKEFSGLYSIHTNHIVIKEEWKDYIEANYKEIADYTMKSFIAYVKQYNTDIKLLKLMTEGCSLIYSRTC